MSRRRIRPALKAKLSKPGYRITLPLANSLHSLIIPQTILLGIPASTGEASAKPEHAEERLKATFPPYRQSLSHETTR